MKVSQPIAHFQVDNGKPTAVPLPYGVTPLVLKPEISAEIARLVSASRSSAQPLDTPGNWSSLLMLNQSVLGLSKLSSGPGPGAGPAVPPASQALPPWNLAPLDPKLWLRPRPSEALNPQELKPLSPGLWLRPLPGPAATLANASHMLAATQIGLETLKPLGVNPSFSPQLNTALDAATAVVAVGELIQETTRPTLRGFKRLLYFSKRLLYLAKFITDVAPVAPSVQHTFTVVGLVVRGTDELHSMTLTAKSR